MSIYCVLFAVLTSKCSTIAIKIRVVFVTLGLFGDEADGGLKRIATNPSFPWLRYTFWRSSYVNPLPQIFINIFFFKQPEFVCGSNILPMKVCIFLWRLSLYSISFTAWLVLTSRDSSTMILTDNCSLDKNWILWRAITSSKASWALKDCWNKISYSEDWFIGENVPFDVIKEGRLHFTSSLNRLNESANQTSIICNLFENTSPAFRNRIGMSNVAVLCPIRTVTTSLFWCYTQNMHTRLILVKTTKSPCPFS